MPTITLEVPEKIFKKFANRSYIKYEEIIDYEKDLHYNFEDEKVSLEELSNFLWDVISFKKEKQC